MLVSDSHSTPSLVYGEMITIGRLAITCNDEEMLVARNCTMHY
jgi:hypothetical protein